MNFRVAKKTYLISLLFVSAASFAAAEISTKSASTPSVSTPSAIQAEGAVEERAKKEDSLLPNNFAISFYKPTYILPYYYTASPDNAVYEGHTPDDEQLKSAEFKYQLSFKVPVWKNILNHPSSLYFAYTQLSYWQLYNKQAFFRETDYEPEIFLANEINFPLMNKGVINFLNVGAVHQSNGFGGTQERTWNRIYLEAISSVGNWMLSVKPWYIMQDSAMNNHNPNIGEFLGYGQMTLAYKYHNQVFSLGTHNILFGEVRRATAQLTWSFPLTSYIKGYVQVFSGYGQSLIEYNHRTNSAGVGIALSDWL